MSIGRWVDVALADPYQGLTSFGVYVHHGRVYIEGAFYFDFTTADVNRIGSIPAGYAPSVTTVIPVFTERQNSYGPQKPQLNIEVSPTGDIQWPSGGLPLRPDWNAYCAIVHSSWPYSIGESDDFATGVYGTGGGHAVEHDNRLHLADGFVFTGPTHSELVLDGIPNSGLAVPYSGLGSSWRRVMAIPCASTIREIQTYLWGSGGDGGLGFFQVDEPYVNNIGHATYDNGDLGFAADYGGWRALGFPNGDSNVHIATFGDHDVSEAFNYFEITHNIEVTDTAYATSTNDPTDITVPGVIALEVETSTASIYYKLMLQSFGGNLVKALYRRDADGSYTLIGSLSEATYVGFQVFRVQVFEVAGYIAAPGAPANIDTYTDGLVFRVFHGSSNTTYTAFHDNSTQADEFISRINNASCGISGPEASGTNWTRGHVGFIVSLGHGSAGVPISVRIPNAGTAVSMAGLGWHLTDPPDEGVMSIDMPTRGIVPLGSL